MPRVYTNATMMYMKQWSFSEARRNFAQVLEEANAEPQAVYRRDQLAGAVIGPHEFEAFQEWRRVQGKETLASITGSLRVLCEQEDYRLEVPARRNRANPFGDEGTP